MPLSAGSYMGALWEQAGIQIPANADGIALWHGHSPLADAVPDRGSVGQ